MLAPAESGWAITGIVVDPAGVPLEGVEIITLQQVGDRWRDQAKSLADGTFDIRPPSEGEYDLTFQGMGFGRQTQSAKLRPAKHRVDLGKIVMTIDCGQPGVICDDFGLK